MGRTTDVSPLFQAAVFVDGASLPLQIEAHTHSEIESSAKVDRERLIRYFGGCVVVQEGVIILRGAPRLHYKANGTLEHKEDLQRATSHPRARDDKAASGDVNQWMKATRRDSRAKCRR